MDSQGTWDVAVIGASGAGLLAAWHLARGGKRVAVFERDEPWQPARRTLIITPSLRRFLPFSVEGAVLHTTPVMGVASGNVEAEIRLKEPDLIVERGAFLRLLADQARQAGATLCFGHRLIDMGAEDARTATLVFHTPSRRTIEAQARAIIGADGVFSQVARLVGLRRPQAVTILQAEVMLPAGWDPDRVQVWFDRRDSRFFYWLIPESPSRGVVGLVTDLNQNIHALLTRFLDRLGGSPEAYQGARVAMYSPRLRPWGYVGNVPVYLVGDAAGQVKVTTVGGTVTGLWGGALAARALLENIPYSEVIAPLKQELDLHWILRKLLDRLNNAGYETLIRALTPRVCAFLSMYTRDEMAGRFWRLALTTPALWKVFPHILRWRRRVPPQQGTALPESSELG